MENRRAAQSAVTAQNLTAPSLSARNLSAQNRYVALGDSFTEGVGDRDESRPNGVRGWADRVAEVLLDQGDWAYANLAIRGRKVREIVEEQIPRALELRPTLVTCYAGGNDILRPSVDIDGVVEHYVEALLPLKEQGASVAVFTAFDPGDSKTFAATRGRYALYTEFIREAAEKHGFTVIDYWRMREFRDWRHWDEDRLHMSSSGHALMARNVLRTLGHDDDSPVPDLGALPTMSIRERVAGDVEWARKHFAPWVGRRLRGVSSGDGLTPKYPDYVMDFA